MTPEWSICKVTKLLLFFYIFLMNIQNLYTNWGASVATNCISITIKCQNKQTGASAALFSICTKPADRWAAASCLAGYEIGFTLEKTQLTEMFFYLIFPITGFQAHWQSLRWGGPSLQVTQVSLWLRNEMWEQESVHFVCQWTKFEGELSATPVRCMNKLHLFATFLPCEISPSKT